MVFDAVQSPLTLVFTNIFHIDHNAINPVILGDLRDSGIIGDV